MRFLIVLCCALLSTLSLSAQGVATLGSADSLYFAGRVAEAEERYEALLAVRPADFDVLCRASRADLTVGMLSERGAVQEVSFQRAEAFARRAIAVDSTRADGHYWLAAALGREALRAELKKSTGLAKATHAAALRALAIDSLHAGAHDVLGKLHSEVRNLSGFVRFVAGRLLGMSIARETSWETAELHLKRAIALDPASVLYRSDLAQLYLRMNRRADALRVMTQIVAMPRVMPWDGQLQRDAQQRLDESAKK